MPPFLKHVLGHVNFLFFVFVFVRGGSYRGLIESTDVVPFIEPKAHSFLSICLAYPGYDVLLLRRACLLVITSSASRVRYILVYL